MKKSFALLLVFVCACNPLHEPPIPPLPANITGRAISRADAIADFGAMMKMFGDVHPDLYAVWSRDSADAMQRRIIAALPESMSRVEWWKRLAPFVAKFGDGHTNIQPPTDELRHDVMLPPSVVLDDDRHLIVSAPFAPGSGLSRGDRVVRVNDLSADSLLAAWTERVSGESESYRATTVADAFRSYVAMEAIAPPYRLKVEAVDGTPREVSLGGITGDSLFALLLRRPRAASPVMESRTAIPVNPNFTYRALERGIGYMDFRTMAGDLGQFHKNVTAMFKQVVADSDRVLIVDLRQNGGGDDRIGMDFLSHVTTKPYRDGARKEWKMSAEYRAYIATGVTPPIMALKLWVVHPRGRAMFGGAAGKVVSFPEEAKSHQRSEPFFSGAVCVLTGPRTFSSAADISDAIKTYHLATIIGEETGGRVNTFGEALFFRLPRSGIFASVSSARFVRASGDTSDHRGVTPDIQVVPTAADRAAGRDAVLERAKNCEKPKGG